MKRCRVSPLTTKMSFYVFTVNKTEKLFYLIVGAGIPRRICFASRSNLESIKYSSTVLVLSLSVWGGPFLHCFGCVWGVRRIRMSTVWIHITLILMSCSKYSPMHPWKRPKRSSQNVMFPVWGGPFPHCFGCVSWDEKSQPTTSWIDEDDEGRENMSLTLYAMYVIIYNHPTLQ